MIDVKWVKLYTGIFDDEKIQLIWDMPEGIATVMVFIRLIVLAGKRNFGHGEVFVNESIAHNAETLATLFKMKLNTVRLSLTTLQKFGLIDVHDDGTIVIRNWFKYQNIEGLEKIRQDTAERTKRWRERKRLSDLERYGDASRDVTDNVTNVTGDASRDVTRDEAVTLRDAAMRHQNKNKSTDKEKPPTIPQSGGLPEDDDSLTTFEQGKAWFDNFFHRNRPWTYEEMLLLKQLLPISRDDLALLTWADRLGPDHQFHQQTKLKQELTTLLRGFNGEIDKIKKVRALLGLIAKPKQKN